MKKLRKRLKKVVKGAAIAAAVYFTGGAALAALGTAGTVAVGTAGLSLAQQRQNAKAAAANAEAARAERDIAAINTIGMSGPISPGYSAPFNPGYSYTGGASDFMGAGGMTYGGGGAAIPEQQMSGKSSSGITLSPLILIGGLVALFGGILLLRR